MIDLEADKVVIKGPKIDGSYTITFEAGEYQQTNVAEILKIPQGTVIKVRIEYERN